MDTNPASDVVTVEVRNHVALVWLDRPDQRNAMAPPFWLEFPGVIEGLGADDEIRAIVLAAKGPAFTIGLDLTAFGPVIATGSLAPDPAAPASPVAHRRATFALLKRMQRAASALADCPKPVIAAIHGYCIGAGVDLVTGCDIRYAAADATFSVRETKLALVADVGTLQRLPAIVDPGWVAEIAYTGRDFSADEALDMGLVSRVLPDAAAVQKEALALAEQIATNSPLAVQGTKAVLRAGRGRSIEESLDYVALWNAAFMHSDDLGEAISAFVERRPPDFEGR